MDEELNNNLEELEREFDRLESIANSVRGEFSSLRDSIKELQRMQSTIASITSDLKSPLLSAIVRFSQGNQMQSKLIEVQQKRIEVMEAEIPTSDAAIAIAQEKIRISQEELNKLQGTDEESVAKRANIEVLQENSETILKEKTTVESRIQELQDELSEGKLSRKKKKEVKRELDAQQSILQQLNVEYSSNEEQLQSLIQELSDLESASGISKLTEEEKTERIKQLNDAIAKETGVIEENIRNREQLEKDLEAERRKLKQLELQKLAKSLSDINAIFRALIDPVRKTQQAFGITAGLALQNNVNNAINSIESFFDSAMSGFQEAAVTGAEIQAAQQAFFQEFGGVITSDAAKELAMQAKTLGITSAELAKARRVFMTQTLGDLSEARIQQDRIVAAFKEQGLTSRDAMQAIAQYSEIAARMGTRFQQSFAEAAADAKKIGVDLNKVNQVGDNIIGNFEGFLTSMAELGAMGFGFDSTRLAEIAESGDTGALFQELRSQLQGMGKDITNLRRSEQLALSQAFGMDISEFQRMAAGEEGSGEEMVDQQKESNAFLKLLTGLVEGANVAAAAIAAVQTGLLTVIAYNTGVSASKDIVGAINSFLKGGGALAGAARFGMGTAGVGIGVGSAMMGKDLVEEGKTKTGIGLGALGGSLGALLTGIAILGAIPSGGTSLALLGAGAVLGGGYAATGMGKADDMISRPGYGDRMLVTASGPVALNDKDTVVAYADDMISREAGLMTGPIGTLTGEAPNINIDFSSLERKLDELKKSMETKDDRLVRTLGSMNVHMDGAKVGSVLVASEERANMSAAFRNQRL